MEQGPLFFLSYARANEEFVLRLAADLQEQGVRVWVDQSEIRAGKPWDNQINRGLVEAQTLIFVLTPESLGSEIAMGEAFAAHTKGKRILPILLHPCEPPVWMNRVQFIDFTGAYHQALAALLDACDAPEQQTQLISGTATRTTSLGALIRSRAPHLLPALCSLAIILMLSALPREWIWLPLSWRAVIFPTGAFAGLFLYHQIREKSDQKSNERLAALVPGESRVGILRDKRLHAQRMAMVLLLVGSILALTLFALATERIRPVGDSVDLLDSEIQFPDLVDESGRMVFRPMFYSLEAKQHVVASVADFPNVETLPRDWDIQMIDGVANHSGIEPYLDGVWTFSQTSFLLTKVLMGSLFLGASLGIAAGIAFGVSARRDQPLEPPTESFS